MISDGENGILVPPGDPQALAHAASALLADADLRDRISARARQIIIKDWSIDIMAARTMQVYEEVLSCRQRKSPDRLSTRQLLRERLATISGS